MTAYPLLSPKEVVPVLQSERPLTVAPLIVTGFDPLFVSMITLLLFFWMIRSGDARSDRCESSREPIHNIAIVNNMIRVFLNRVGFLTVGNGGGTAVWSVMMLGPVFRRHRWCRAGDSVEN